MFKVFIAVAVLCCATLAQGAVMEVTPVEGNATPAVCAVAARLRDGDTLRFTKGEYHFFAEGAKEMFLASVGSSTGMKKVVVHLEGLKDVTIDGGGSSFVFHGDTFPLNEPLCLLLGCGRTRSVMAFSNCRDVEVADVTARSGVAMGIVAEMCENIRILRYIVRPDEGRYVSLTADAIFLVDTKGRIEIADSEISWGLDDVMNIHGNYTTLGDVNGREVVLKIQHHFYAGYFPYRVGEKVEFTRGNGTSKELVGLAA